MSYPSFTRCVANERQNMCWLYLIVASFQIPFSRERGGVGTVVAHRPLLRSGRADFPHPAPTSGKKRQCDHDTALACPLRSLRTLDPALCPERVLLERPPLGQPPSLHHLRGRIDPALFGFLGTTELSDFPCSCIAGVCPKTSRRDLWKLTSR